MAAKKLVLVKKGSPLTVLEFHVPTGVISSTTVDDKACWVLTGKLNDMTVDMNWTIDKSDYSAWAIADDT